MLERYEKKRVYDIGKMYQIDKSSKMKKYNLNYTNLNSSAHSKQRFITEPTKDSLDYLAGNQNNNGSKLPQLNQQAQYNDKKLQNERKYSNKSIQYPSERANLYEAQNENQIYFKNKSFQDSE